MPECAAEALRNGTLHGHGTHGSGRHFLQWVKAALQKVFERLGLDRMYAVDDLDQKVVTAVINLTSRVHGATQIPAHDNCHDAEQDQQDEWNCDHNAAEKPDHAKKENRERQVNHQRAELAGIKVLHNADGIDLIEIGAGRIVFIDILRCSENVVDRRDAGQMFETRPGIGRYGCTCGFQEEIQQHHGDQANDKKLHRCQAEVRQNTVIYLQNEDGQAQGEDIDE